MASFLLLAACGSTQAPPAAPCPQAPLPPATTASAADRSAQSETGLTVLLRPSVQPSRIVHVEIDVDAPGADLSKWRMARGVPERIQGASARDATGDVPVRAKAAGTSVELTLERMPKGAVHLAYDVVADEGASDDPLAVLVLEDRFRGAGESLLALPVAIEDASLPVTLKIEPEGLKVRGAASSLGTGKVRRVKARPRALRYASFLAGSMGAGEFDAIEGHDEGAWLGYTAFDPRPAVAELAQVRTALGETFKADVPLAPWMYLFVSQSRAIGSFTTTPRAGSTLVQLGPSDAWGAALRLSIAQQLVRPWVGGELRIATGPGKEAEGYWFSEGVARHVAMRTLARLGLLTPNQWREAISGELSALATSPHRALGNAELAALAAKGDAVARATITARGALYAARQGAQLRARSKGEKSLEQAMLAWMLAARAKVAPGQATESAVSAADWVQALSKDDPDAAKTFETALVKGEPVALPAGALGPCFRASNGKYVAFDAGFDVDRSKADKDGKVTGVRQGGPADKAGLRDGDVLESMQAQYGNAEAPVKLVVTRAGKKMNLTYAPRGSEGRGQVWTRVPGIADDRCGDPP